MLDEFRVVEASCLTHVGITEFLYLYYVILILSVSANTLFIVKRLFSLNKACSGVSSTPINEGYPKGAPSLFWFQLAAGTIVLYMILVPAVLFTAPGVPVSV